MIDRGLIYLGLTTLAGALWFLRMVATWPPLDDEDYRPTAQDVGRSCITWMAVAIVIIGMTLLLLDALVLS